MLEIIWGLKTHAILDVWTIEHLLSGISVGSAVKKKNHKTLQKILNLIEHNHHSWWFDISGVLFIAYIWEALEHYLEVGLAGSTVEYWFQGVEFWPNRLIADPLMLVLGYLIAKNFPWLVWPARLLSIGWLIVHIFVFPHSMYLHELF
jgi:hypothetical protein